MTTASLIRPTSERREDPEFIGHWPRLTGRQEPEFESRQDGDEDEGDRCAKFGKNIGLRCMPWEWMSVRGILSLRPPNEFGERLWTHRDSCIECTRQQGKTLIIVLLLLFLMFVKPAFGRARVHKIIYTAQQWSTVSDVFDRLEAVIMRVPYMRKRLAAPPSKRDNHGVIKLAKMVGGKPVMANGKPVIDVLAEFGPRSKNFARGYTEVDVVIFDEAYDIDPGHEANLTGSQSASPNPLTVYLSTPPVKGEHPDCHTLADLHRQGHRRARDLFYQLFGAPRHMSREDPATWRMAQPSYGVATNEREIRSKVEKAKKSTRRRAIFDADYCGWGDYPPPETEGNTEIPAEKWADMKAKSVPVLIGSPAVVLEREPGGLWVIVAAWRTTSGPMLIEVGWSGPDPVAKVAERVSALVGSWDPAALVVRSGSAAAEATPDLENAGIEVTTLNRIEVAQACGGFLNAALGGELMHGGQPELDDAVSAAVKKDMPAGGFIWELVDETSYPALMGASLAHYALIKYGAPPKRPPAKPQGGATKRRTRSESNVMEMSF